MKLLGRIVGAMFAFLLFVLASTTRSFGQTKPAEGTPQVPTIKVRTKLVLIPAVVVDTKGNRVTDLKKEEFVVLEDGKRQEIELFDHVTTKAEVMKPADVPAGVFTNAVKQGPNRVTIFVLDLLNSKMEEQKEARKELFEFLSKSIDVKEPVCLVAVDSKGAWLIHGFTTDPKILAEALNHLKQQPADTDRPVKNPEEQIFKTVAGWHTHNAAENAAAEESRLNMLSTEVGLQDMAVAERARLTLLSLMEIGNAFAGIPGRKSLIWTTAGFPFGVNNAVVFQKGGVLQGSSDPGMFSLYEQTWRKLEAANIAIYPLDVSELVNPGYANTGMGEPPPQHVSMDMQVANLEDFADATGGRFCSRNMDAKKCFDEAMDDSSDYYLLGIYDKSGTEKPGWRKLSVRSMRSDVHVRARSGYYLSGAAHDPPTDNNLMETALFSTFDYTGLPISVRLMDPAAGSKPGAKKVSFVYSIPPAAVRIDLETGNQLRLEFGAVARDSMGKMVGSFTKVVEGKMSEAQARQVREKGILFTGEMELALGEYSLSFAVMDKVNENTGSVMAPMKVE
jgi:VWFA-related protein